MGAFEAFAWVLGKGPSHAPPHGMDPRVGEWAEKRILESTFEKNFKT